MNVALIFIAYIIHKQQQEQKIVCETSHKINSLLVQYIIHIGLAVTTTSSYPVIFLQNKKKMVKNYKKNKNWLIFSLWCCCWCCCCCCCYSVCRAQRWCQCPQYSIYMRAVTSHMPYGCFKSKNEGRVMQHWNWMTTTATRICVHTFNVGINVLPRLVSSRNRNDMPAKYSLFLLYR